MRAFAENRQAALSPSRLHLLPQAPVRARPIEKDEQGTRSFARFLVAGTITTIVSYALFVVLELVVPYLIAYALAYVAGIVISYLLNTRVVFRVERKWSTFFRFPIVYALQFLVGSATTVLLVESFGIGPRVAVVIALVVTVPMTYLATKFVLRGEGTRAG